MRSPLPCEMNPRIDAISPYVPGKPTQELERDLGLSGTIKLASNENPLGPSPLAVEAMREAARKAHRYPDGGAFYLKQRLSRELGLPPECLIVGNGSTEIVEMLAKAFLPPDGVSLVSDGAFIMYRIASMAASASARAVPMTADLRHDLPAMAAAIDDRIRLVFIANPNNPTGTRVGVDELHAFLEAVPPTLLTVVDEAYREYLEDDPDHPDAADAVRRGKKVMVLRTFSKIHGLAGARIGYGIAAPEIVSALEKVRSPFNTNAVGQAGALGALDDPAHVHNSRHENARELRHVQTALRERGIEHVPSCANFVLVKPGPPGDQAFNALLRQGVIVRPMGGYGFPDHLRVSMGTTPENRRFLEALDYIRHGAGLVAS